MTEVFIIAMSSSFFSEKKSHGNKNSSAVLIAFPRCKFLLLLLPFKRISRYLLSGRILTPFYGVENIRAGDEKTKIVV